jgi:REP element-mobilizing transposase RayT
MIMAKNWRNIYLDNTVHLITGTVHQWQPVILYPEITKIMYDKFNEKSLDYETAIIAYVLMPEHFHLLIYSATGTKAKGFLQGARRAISGEAKHFIERYDDSFCDYCRNNNVDIKAFYELTAGKSQFRFWKDRKSVV